MNIYNVTTPVKLQFFAFGAEIFESYLVMFQTDLAMVPFMFAQLEKIFDKLHRPIFCQESLAAPVTDKLKKKCYRTLKTILKVA